MYKLVHTHTKSEIAYAHSYVTCTFFISPQYQTFSKSREWYHNSSNPQENKKIKITRHKIKYFCLFENSQCFWIFCLF